MYRVSDAAGRRLVLKVPVIGEERTTGYSAGLAFFECGGIHLLKHDAESGAMLMPELEGSAKFSELPEAEAVSQAIDLIRKLSKVSPFPAQSAESWFNIGHSDEEQSTPVEMLRYLLSTTEQASYLHGDLHHSNILWSETGWVAIDPKGLQADRHYEPVAFLRNPAPSLADHPDLDQLMADRIQAFAAGLDLNPWRIWAWAWADLSRESTSPIDQFGDCWASVATSLTRIASHFEPPEGAPYPSV